MQKENQSADYFYSTCPRKVKQDIWPKKPRYFAAAIAMHILWRERLHFPWGGDFGPNLVDDWQGGGISLGGVTLVLTWLMTGRGWHIHGGGVDFGPYLVDDWQGVASMGGSKAKVSSFWVYFAENCPKEKSFWDRERFCPTLGTILQVYPQVQIHTENLWASVNGPFNTGAFSLMWCHCHKTQQHTDQTIGSVQAEQPKQQWISVVRKETDTVEQNSEHHTGSNKKQRLCIATLDAKWVLFVLSYECTIHLASCSQVPQSTNRHKAHLPPDLGNGVIYGHFKQDIEFI